MRYLLHLSYDGTAYHGWQIQPNANTVQGAIQDALFEIFNIRVDTMGCGRTDTGVHASSYYAHFDLDTPLVPNFIKRANIILPLDIRLNSIYEVPSDFNARFAAKSRSYEYRLYFAPDPFRYKYALMLFNKPDFDAMNEAAQSLLSFTEFSSFSKTGADNKTDYCKITEAVWRQHSNEEWKFHITSDRFLRGMVRTIVGTLLLLGNQKITLNDFIQIIESKNRSNAGESVAAHALFLCDIQYDETVFLKQQ